MPIRTTTTTVGPTTAVSNVHGPPAGIRPGTLVCNNTCSAVRIDQDLAPWSCHDYLTIASWGEHYLSLRISNEWWDKCEKYPHLYESLSRFRASAFSTWGVPHQSVDGHPVYSAWTGDDSHSTCINVDTRLVDQCVVCLLKQQPSYVQLRARRHVSNAEKRHRKKHKAELGTCYAPAT